MIHINILVYFQNYYYSIVNGYSKLLYFSDFRHFKETGKSITGLNYLAWQKGPAPKDLWLEMKSPKDDFREFFTLLPVEENSDRLNIIPRMKFNDRHLSKREVRIIKDVAFMFKEATASQMVDVTHLVNDPWDATIREKGKNALIDYVLSFDDTPESLTLKEYQEKHEERQEAKEALGE